MSAGGNLQAAPDGALNTTLHHKEKEAREEYNLMLENSLNLMKQHIKVDWTSMGDPCNEYFLAMAKQRRLASYIYWV